MKKALFIQSILLCTMSLTVLEANNDGFKFATATLLKVFPNCNVSALNTALKQNCSVDTVFFRAETPSDIFKEIDWSLLKKLTFLHANNTYIDDDGLEKIIENCHELKDLSLNHCKGIYFQEKLEINISNLQTRVKISLADTYIDNECLSKILKNCKTLQEITLRDCQYIADFSEIADFIADLKDLVVLDISYSDVTDKCLSKILKNCKKLTKIILSNCQKLTFDTIDFGDQKELAYLDLSHTAIIDTSLKNIIKNHNCLQKIILTGCKKLKCTKKEEYQTREEIIGLDKKIGSESIQLSKYDEIEKSLTESTISFNTEVNSDNMIDLARNKGNSQFLVNNRSPQKTQSFAELTISSSAEVNSNNMIDLARNKGNSQFRVNNRPPQKAQSFFVSNWKWMVCASLVFPFVAWILYQNWQSLNTLKNSGHSFLFKGGGEYQSGVNSAQYKVFTKIKCTSTS